MPKSTDLTPLVFLLDGANKYRNYFLGGQDER